MGERQLKYASNPDAFANAPIWSFTLRELQLVLSNPRYWVGLLAVVVILAVAGPFGTGDDFNLPESLVYWAVISSLTFVVGLAVSMSSGMALYRLIGLEWVSRAAGGVVAGVPVGVLVYAISQFGFGLDMGSWAVFLQIVGYCIVISTAVSILYYLISLETRAAANKEPMPPFDIPFFRRLPPHLGKNLIRISIQDHYVEAVTDRGKHLILMRFSDALDELSQAGGLQVHRSHWVKLDAVEKVHRTADRTKLEMTDGELVPVSRRHLAKVRERFPS